MEHTEGQSGYESAAADGQFDDAPEDVKKSVFIGNSSIMATTTEVDSVLNVRRKRNHEALMEGKQTASEMGGGKMPRKGKRQSLLQTVMAWTKTFLNDIFLKPAPKEDSPNISDKDTMVGLESTGELLIPTGHADAVDDISKGEVDHSRRCKNWDQCLEELRAYKERSGRANPRTTKGLPKADIGLAKWLSNQRCRFREGKLEKEKVDQLLALGCRGFDEVDQGKKRADWVQRLEELRAYKEQTGHANPPKTRGLPKTEFGLACWLVGQRTQFRKGALGKEKLEQLLALGCTGFDGSSATKKTWHQRFEELEAYKEQTGHANPQKTQGSSKADLVLSNWFCNQRLRFREGKLEKEKVDQLLVLGCTGFVDRNSICKTWHQRFEELKAYKDRTGHANPPRAQGLPKEDLVLATWLSEQRRRFREGKLEKEKVDQLLALGCSGFDVNYCWESPT